MRITGIILILALLPACSATQPVDESFHAQMAECGKIVERDERNRCIDAAGRANN